MVETTEVLHVLITRIIEYDDSSNTYFIYRLHGIFTAEGLQKYKNEIKKVRDNHPFNWLFIIPLNRFLEKGMRL